MNLRSIFLTAVVIGIVWYWVKSREVKDRALVAVAKHCKEMSLGLLDQTIALKQTRIGKNAYGSRCIIRTYQFDFTSLGEDRYQGRVVMHGPLVAGISLDPHRID